MAASVSPEKAEHVHVAEFQLPQELKTRASKHPPWRRKSHPENADRLSTSIFVDYHFLEFLVGKGGTTRQKIEKDTGVTLLIPLSKEAEAGKHVVILGNSQQALDKATQQVQEVIDQAFKSPMLPYSHFVSIPLALHSKLLESVTDFQKSVLEYGASGSDGIDESIFVKPATFHFTLLLLKLWSKDRVQVAADCLQRVVPRVHEIFEGSPLTIKLKGVDCMDGYPAEAHVLYADVEPDDQAGRLIKASQMITGSLAEAGLVPDKDLRRSYRLHATLMNTIQRPITEFGYQERIPFDATEIVAKYRHFEWGQYHIAGAHLSDSLRYDENGWEASKAPGWRNALITQLVPCMHAGDRRTSDLGPFLWFRYAINRELRFFILPCLRLGNPLHNSPMLKAAGSLQYTAGLFYNELALNFICRMCAENDSPKEAL